MTKASTAVQALPITREVGVQARVIAVKKSEVRMGWEAASRPGVLDSLRAADEATIEATANALIQRYS
jgi:hypothetical protein